MSGPDFHRNGRRDPAVEAAVFAARHAEAPAEDLLHAALRRDFAGRIALATSFGAESAVLLHMAARIDPGVPVLFLETGMLFPETLDHQRALAERLGLRDLRLIRPEPADHAATDPDDRLHRRDPDACCALRKVRPLERALAGFDAWITGRKRHQGGLRAGLAPVELGDDGRVKLNPLAGWGAAELRDYMERHDLPRHPLEVQGWRSLGCMPCTTRTAEHEDPRAGRWRGAAKTECGIHFIGGKAVRPQGAGAPPG